MKKTKGSLFKLNGIRLPNGAENILALLSVFFDAIILNSVFANIFILWLRNTPQVEIYLSSYYQVRYYLFGFYVFFGLINGVFSIRRFNAPSENFACVTRTMLLTFFTFYMAAFFSRELAAYAHTFPRAIFLLSTAGSICSIFLLRAVIALLFKPHPLLLKTVIIGDIAEGRRIIKHLHRRGGIRFRILKSMASSEIDELASVVLLKHIHEVFVTDPAINLDKFWAQIYYARKEKPHAFNVRITIDTRKASGTVGLHSLEDYPLITIPSFPLNRFESFCKRAFDVCFSIFALIITFPVMLLTALCVRLDSPGPIFYKQRRVGLYGKDFDVIKFRSMRMGSESSNGPVVSTSDDPRISRFGKFIRHFGLDELPQFFLVLIGEMAVVGPRPERPFFVDEYFEFQGRRLSVKPGVTGLAAVNSRYYLRLVDKVTYDYYYLDNYSLILDIKIVFQTIWVLLFKENQKKLIGVESEQFESEHCEKRREE